jgi:hypothetical protein
MTEDHKQQYQSECICDTECRGFVNVKCKNPNQETIEQAAERYYQEHIDQSNIPREHYEREIQDFMVCFADYWQLSQPNPNRIRIWHLRKLNDMLFLGEITFSRMVEILNEIADGKHKERIEI